MQKSLSKLFFSFLLFLSLRKENIIFLIQCHLGFIFERLKVLSLSLLISLTLKDRAKKLTLEEGILHTKEKERIKEGFVFVYGNVKNLVKQTVNSFLLLNA